MIWDFPIQCVVKAVIQPKKLRWRCFRIMGQMRMLCGVILKYSMQFQRRLFQQLCQLRQSDMKSCFCNNSKMQQCCVCTCLHTVCQSYSCRAMQHTGWGAEPKMYRLLYCFSAYLECKQEGRFLCITENMMNFYKNQSQNQIPVYGKKNKENQNYSNATSFLPVPYLIILVSYLNTLTNELVG